MPMLPSYAMPCRAMPSHAQSRGMTGPCGLCQVGDMDQIVELCTQHSVTLIEDCAHSIGVRWRGKHTESTLTPAPS
jgi:hypothetical protein